MLGVVSLGVSVFLTCQSWRFRELAEGIAWLPDRSFERPTLVLVGTGATHENPNRLGPTTAVGLGSRIVLVDAGRGVAEALRHCAVPVTQPDTRAAHEPRAREHRRARRPRAHRLERAAQAGRCACSVRPARARSSKRSTPRTRRASRRSPRRAASIPPARASKPSRSRDGFAEARDGLALRAAAAGDAPLASLAYRFEAGGRAFVVSGVRPDEERLVALATGATTLVGAGFFARSVDMAIEAGAENADQLRREAALDLPLEQLAAIATRAGVGTLVVTRLEPPPLFDEQFQTAIREQFRGRAVIAEECDEVCDPRCGIAARLLLGRPGRPRSSGSGSSRRAPGSKSGGSGGAGRSSCGALAGEAAALLAEVGLVGTQRDRLVDRVDRRTRARRSGTAPRPACRAGSGPGGSVSRTARSASSRASVERLAASARGRSRSARPRRSASAPTARSSSSRRSACPSQAAPPTRSRAAREQRADRRERDEATAAESAGSRGSRRSAGPAHERRRERARREAAEVRGAGDEGNTRGSSASAISAPMKRRRGIRQVAGSRSGRRSSSHSSAPAKPATIPDAPTSAS